MSLRALTSGHCLTTVLTRTAELSYFRSLEPLTGLAVWSDETVIIELEKGPAGLGFSILDYQVPTRLVMIITVVSCSSVYNIKLWHFWVFIITETDHNAREQHS